MNLIDFEKELNPRQWEAVQTNDRPLMILAGAGSGKTRVITYKVAYVLLKGLASPGNILAVTFTNKAAGEMKARISSLLSLDVSRLWIRTFHSTALRILRFHADRIGYEKNFVIYDETDKKTLIRRCIKKSGLDREAFPLRSVMDHISRFKNSAGALAEPWTNDGEKKIYDMYESLKKEYNVLDYDDLLIKSLEIFKTCPDILESFKKRWKYVLVDEYQDVNEVQYQFVRTVTDRSSPVTVVGDDDQAIYAWRGATSDNMNRFEKDHPDLKIIVLDQNYRSTKKIIGAASSLIAHNIHRKPKQLWTENPEGDPVHIHVCEDPYDEARTILDLCRKYHRSGRHWSDLTVFYRTNDQSQPFESLFIEKKIPYRIIGGLRFFERREIKDILAYLRLVINPLDGTSLERIINVPARGIGKVTWGHLERHAYESGSSLLDVMRSSFGTGLRKGTALKVKNFVCLIDDLKKKGDILNVQELAEETVRRTGYLDYLEKLPLAEKESRLRNVEQFLSLLKEKTDQDPGLSLEQYLEELTLFTAVDAMTVNKDRISLITLHNAKGLEFPVVFIAGTEEDLLPYQRSALEGGEDEERRLFYVGITRAQEQLHLLYTQSRCVWGSFRMTGPSRFLQELNTGCFSQTPLSRQRKDMSKSDHFSEGDIVRHKDYGLGSIRQIRGQGDGTLVVVCFESGEKKFIQKYADLIKI